MTTTVLNTKISEGEIKMPDVGGLVKKTEYDAKILDFEKKYFTAPDYNKFMSDILDRTIKQIKLVNESSILDLVKNSNLNTKLAILRIKA